MVAIPERFRRLFMPELAQGEEIRAVSNPVGPRDRAAWRIGEALGALTGAFGKLAPVLESWNAHDHD